MSEINGKNVELTVAEALRGVLKEDGFVASEVVVEYANHSFVVLRDEEDGSVSGARVIIQPVSLKVPF